MLRLYEDIKIVKFFIKQMKGYGGEMIIAVIDGQGGGIGKAIVERIKTEKNMISFEFTMRAKVGTISVYF